MDNHELGRELGEIDQRLLNIDSHLDNYNKQLIAIWNRIDELRTEVVKIKTRSGVMAAMVAGLISFGSLVLNFLGVVYVIMERLK